MNKFDAEKKINEINDLFKCFQCCLCNNYYHLLVKPKQLECGGNACKRCLCYSNSICKHCNKHHNRKDLLASLSKSRQKDFRKIIFEKEIIKKMSQEYRNPLKDG